VRRIAASPLRRAAPRSLRATAPRRLAAPRPVARTRGRRDRTGAVAAAVLALAILVWILWPASPPPLPATPTPTPAAAQVATTSREPRKTAPRRAAPAAKPAAQALDEARVRAAILARAPGLSACPVPAGAPSQVPVRLRVPASGEVRSVQFAGSEPLPPALSGCLREKLLAWRFDDLHLSSDVELFATFALR